MYLSYVSTIVLVTENKYYEKVIKEHCQEKERYFLTENILYSSSHIVNFLIIPRDFIVFI